MLDREKISIYCEFPSDISNKIKAGFNDRGLVNVFGTYYALVSVNANDSNEFIANLVPVDYVTTPKDKEPEEIKTDGNVTISKSEYDLLNKIANAYLEVKK